VHNYVRKFVASPADYDARTRRSDFRHGLRCEKPIPVKALHRPPEGVNGAGERIARAGAQCA